MTKRYFVAAPIAQPVVRLDAAEAHHLIHVMRCSAGDAVTLFDGSGAEYSAVVESIQRREVLLNIVERHEVDRELPLRVELGVALAKGDRQQWLVEKATELGVARLVPLVTSRTVARGGEPHARLARSVIEASKQCGRNILMEIAPITSVADFLRQPGGGVERPTPRLLADPAGFSIGALGEELRAHIQKAQSVYLCVGPEGGFDADELVAARNARWRPVSLGRRTLRVETAALALVAAVSNCLAED